MGWRKGYLHFCANYVVPLPARGDAQYRRNVRIGSFGGPAN